MSEVKYRVKWSEEETILAFYYYCRIPFGRINKTNPEIIRIAALLGRTPSSVVFKMGNLGHWDPSLQKRGVNGLSNGSKLDEEIVGKFCEDWEGLAVEAAKIEAQFAHSTEEIITQIDTLPPGDERVVSAKTRINQNFFREAVISAYSGKCCITGIAVPTLLVASHIKPWAASDPKTERTNPSNGLCLNALHDKAFDKGLITVLPNHEIRVSDKLKKEAETDTGIAWLVQCDKQQIVLPHKFFPSKEFLEYHNDVIFIAG